MSDRIKAFNASGLHSDNDGYHDRAPREEIDTLQQLNREGRRVESLMHVMHLIREYPSDKLLYGNAATTMTKLGEQAQECGDEEGALDLWNSALQYSLSGLKIDPNDRRLLTQTAKSYRQLGEYEASEDFYLRGVRVNDADKFTWTGMGELYMRWGNEGADITDTRYDELMQDAIDCFQEACKIDPRDEKVWRKIDELEAEGYTASPDGYDIGDPALDAINNAEMVKPQNFRFPNRAPGLDM